MARTCSPAAMLADASTTPGRGKEPRQALITGWVPVALSGVPGARRTSCSYASPTVWPSIQCTGLRPLRTASSRSANSWCGGMCGRRRGGTEPGLRWSRRPGGLAPAAVLAAPATVLAAAASVLAAVRLLIPVVFTQIAPVLPTRSNTGR